MIRDQLPPIDLQQHISVEEVAQALAYSCLSYYTDGALEPRVASSFERAFAHNTLVRTPPTNPLIGLRKLGWVAALWNDGLTKRLVIAVTGTTNPEQLFTSDLYNAFTGLPFELVALTGRPGAVFRQWKLQADALWADIVAHPIVGGLLGTLRTVVTIVGHSAGAAVAEIMASNLKYNAPERRVRLVKFACPRIGNASWRPFVSAYAPAMNVVCGDDPIHLFPQQGLRLNVDFNPLTNGLSPVSIWQSLVRDPQVIRIRRDGATWAHGYKPDGLTDLVRAMGWTLRAMEPGNPWFDHSIWSYRLGMMNFAASIRDVLELRFNYLEMPSENTWQTAFTPGRGDWRTWFAVNPIQPPDQVPESTAQEEGAGGGGDDYGPPIQPVMQPLSDDGGGGGGQLWGGAVDRIQTQTLPRRRIRLF